MTDIESGPSIEEQLEAWLEKSLAELGEAPTDLDHAGKLLGAQRGIDRRIAEVDAVVARRIEELKAFQREQRDPLLARRAHLDKLIGGWALAEWERTGRKTWKVPEGVIEVRPRKPRMVIDSRLTLSDELVRSVESLLPAAVKTERSILVSGVKSDDAFEVTPGDVIPDYPETPEGYEARAVVAKAENLTTTVKGVVALIPVAGRAGQVATPRPGKGSQ